MYKLYENGTDFLAENADILARYPLETVFFELNAKNISHTNKNDFLIRLDYDGKFLLAVHCSHYPMEVFGDKSLCAELARIAVGEQLTFGKVLGVKETCEDFLAEYARLTNATYEVNHAMDIMQCAKVKTTDVDGVERATENDLDEIAQLASCFESEALGESDVNGYKHKLQSIIRDFALIKRGGKIVSFAAKVRESQRLCAIGWVYTLPQYRNMGLSCKVVTYLTNAIVGSGRLAYLFVDKTNPISNHLYNKIGYSYAVPQYEYKLIRG